MFNEDDLKDIDLLLAASIDDIDTAYSEFIGEQMNAFLSESYHELNTAYKAIFHDLSPVYCSGSDWYCGENLTAARFHDILVSCLICSMV